jgi:TonB family protein
MRHSVPPFSTIGGSMIGIQRSTLLIAAFAATLVAAGAAAQDYSDLRMREGDAAYRERHFADAAALFRLAAFGFVDRPPMLCQALVRFAIASDAAGHPADVKTAMDRLADAQRRAPTCSEAEIDPATRADFEARFRRRWPGGEPIVGTYSAEVPASPAAATRSVPADTSASKPATTRTLRQTSEPAPAPASRTEGVAENGGARLKSVVHPAYPRSAVLARARGVVILRVLVSEEGIPLQVEVVQGVRPDLNAAAVTAIKRCVFEPAIVGGRPVRSTTMVSVPFQP